MNPAITPPPTSNPIEDERRSVNGAEITAIEHSPQTNDRSRRSLTSRGGARKLATISDHLADVCIEES
jgi:hypothetical protein